MGHGIELDVVPEVESPAHRLSDEDGIGGLFDLGGEIGGGRERHPVGQHEETTRLVRRLRSAGRPRSKRVGVIVTARIVTQIEHDFLGQSGPLQQLRRRVFADLTYRRVPDVENIAFEVLHPEVRPGRTAVDEHS